MFLSKVFCPHTMKKILYILLVCLFLGACATQEPVAEEISEENDVPQVEEKEVSTTTFKELCEAGQGTWDAKYSECEYIAQDVCEQAGGRFDECASACRHKPQGSICTQQCIPLCTFV